MAIPEFVREFFRLEPETCAFWLNFGIDLGFFLLALLLSLLVGRLTPFLVRWLVWRFAPQRAAGIYANLIAPIKNLFWIAGTLILISLSLQIVQPYEALYGFLGFFFDLALIAGIAWLLSRLFRQFVRAYGIDLIRRLGREVNELLLIVETVANVMIGFFAVVAFAQSQNFNLVGLLAGVGIGGLAIAFAAQRTLEQLLGTIVLYLDRPFVPGEYIRANFNPAAPDLYGRIESIGLRSTKIPISCPTPPWPIWTLKTLPAAKRSWCCCIWTLPRSWASASAP
jgi:small-conductance mechanosensitive channel